MNAELVLDCRNHHGAGIFWNSDNGCLWWTDIEGRCLWSFNPETGESQQFKTADRVCCFAPRHSGGLIVGFADRISLFDLDSGHEEKIHDFEPSNPDTRLNDGRTDRQGRLIIGGMNEGTGAANSSVVRVNLDLSISELFSNIACANSTCFSPDGRTMYFADTPDKEIVAYDYDTTTSAEVSAVTNKRVHCSFAHEPGLPDGSCVNAEGGVWNAECIESLGGKQRMQQVRKYFPDEKPYRMVYCEDPFGNIFELYSHSYELTYSAEAYV